MSEEMRSVSFCSAVTGWAKRTKVTRTKRKPEFRLDKFVGRIINALGAPIDGEGDIQEDDYRPIENEAPGIVDRKSVQRTNGDRESFHRFHVPDWPWTKRVDHR